MMEVPPNKSGKKKVSRPVSLFFSCPVWLPLLSSPPSPCSSLSQSSSRGIHSPVGGIPRKFAWPQEETATKRVRCPPPAGILHSPPSVPRFFLSLRARELRTPSLVTLFLSVPLLIRLRLRPCLSRRRPAKRKQTKSKNGKKRYYPHPLLFFLLLLSPRGFEKPINRAKAGILPPLRDSINQGSYPHRPKTKLC